MFTCSTRRAAHLGCTFEITGIADIECGLSLPQIHDQPAIQRARTGQILGLKLIAHTAAPPIGLACTFIFSARTFLYQRDISTSIVGKDPGRYCTCDTY